MRSPKRWHALAADGHAALRERTVAQLRTRFANTLEPARRDAVARRLEHMLFHAAHSRAEFAHACSLERRVQALVTQTLESPATAEAPVATPASAPAPQLSSSSDSNSSKEAAARRPTCLKRARRASVAGDSAAPTALSPACKRRRRGSFHAGMVRCATHALAPAVHAREAGAFTPNGQREATATSGDPQDAVAAHTKASTLFLDNDRDLVALVFQFLDGAEVLRARAVNQFLAAHATSMVQSLTLDARRLPAAAAPVAPLLLACANLRRLVVTNSRNAGAGRSLLSDLPRGYSVPSSSAAAGSPHRTPLCYGSQLLAQVSAALRHRACPALEALELRAPFEFATESDSVLECLDALAFRFATVGQCTPRPVPLRRLALDTTFLGDARVQQLAARLHSANSYFSGLDALLLRGNFVGEAGCAALFAALPQCAQLRELDLSGNILTDTDALALAAALKRSSCNGSSSSGADGGDVAPLALLQRIALHENFVGLEGLCALSSALCTRLLAVSDEEMDARGSGRSLIEVTCAKNCAPVRKAARLFQF
ncbi:hypothetical protein PybrP1_001389 [[Pythium] brassicae (nom. inval.)]|nr:hypothetical protein PybrP1_001389 [[Pythium] brassicae (nom. inval.)]